MRVFKFGGASVKDAKSIQNVADVLRNEGTNNVLVVISAMGKMTNAFEKVVHAYIKDNGLEDALEYVLKFHTSIAYELFARDHSIHEKVTMLFGKLSAFFAQNKSKDYDFIYDQIVCFGELISTTIVSAYFSEIGIGNNWLDVRDLIRTNNTFRAAKVDWETTKKNINQSIKKDELNIVQGFISSDGTNTTTLGREGSDFTAGIFAYCLGAESVTIWKDVDGVLNADPRAFDDTTLLEQISYEEAIEMAFYGASVIHPKTIKPLQNLEIPLHVRSFVNYEKPGTTVSKGKSIYPEIPCFIVKKNQILVSISSLDFSFMVENNISHIFKRLAEYQLKVNLIQNSAISFSVCVEDNFNKFRHFLEEMQSLYKIDYTEGLSLFTIRHFNEESRKAILKRGVSLLTQINKETLQITIRE
ncbi:aspartate kinase [Flavobacteriaceae bacterium S356]|uniref:Aspartokinase n=1 Tax=Asprobacillus argus TaxID=3076534 RepID=A0ABU3LGV0_9FLAO|nr:aspartate kinase [Flavobacteriaceae bacterium S356]